MTTPAEPTLYELLGVEPSAPADEIRAAYRRLMRAAHPDTGGTAGLFRTVQLAYDTLSDPQRRADYDASLRSSSPTTPNRPTPGRSPAPGSASGSPGASSTTGGGSSPRSTGHSSLFRPMERPPHVETARIGAIFDPPLFPDEDSAGTRRRRGRGPVALGRGRGGREPRAATDILPMQTLRDRTIGEPGAGTDSMGLGARAAAMRREAARRTAEVVEAAVLPAYPAMRLLNDLRDPGTRRSTIDHAVIVGDHAILIDSLMVDPAALTWDGTHVQPTGSVPSLTLPRLMEQARLWLDPWRVSGVSVLHSTDGLLSAPSILRASPPARSAPVDEDPVDRVPAGEAPLRGRARTGGVSAPVSVLNPRELVDFLREAAVLEARTHVVNVRLLRAVLQMRPDSRPRA